MKTVSELRKEVLKNHLTYEIKGNKYNLFKFNEQSIKLATQK